MRILTTALLFLISACSQTNWRTASREPAGISDPANEIDDHVIQIYTARAFSWRGTFAVHPWVSWKKKGDEEFTVAQVIGWRLRSKGSSVSVAQDFPDRKWFGSTPNKIFEIRGEKALSAIKSVEKLIADYPYFDQYRLWPGPNSNTFVQYLIRNTDELTVELPPHAIGKDWLVKSNVIDRSPSGTGVQVSLLGAAGITLGLKEGIEVNILSLNFGLDFWPPAIKLPLIGRLGFPDRE